MSQYQRLISYLYRYEKGTKKENTGYARIELRGEFCRITVQLQDNMQNINQQSLPEVFLFIQKDWGMERIAAGQLRKNGNSYSCRIETRTENIMNTEKSFADLDGLLLYKEDDLFYATTWKDITLLLGTREQELEAAEMEEDRKGEKELFSEEKVWKTVEANELETVPSQEMLEQELESQEETSQRKPEDRKEILKERTERWEENSTRRSESQQKSQEDILQERESKTQGKRKADFTKEQCQCQNCSQCPQRGRKVDFGSHILSVFPKMYPFEIEHMGECVRLELKDMGCLPVEHWSLAGNPFLLHGYYCYRHIIFTKHHSQKYCIGVPGIYSRENQKKAEECGFHEFQSLSQVRELQGAFGYWLYPVES